MAITAFLQILLYLVQLIFNISCTMGANSGDSNCLPFKRTLVHARFFDWVSVVYFALLQVFMFLFLCCDVHVKMMFDSSLLPFVSQGVYILLMLFVFNYIYWCSASHGVCVS